MTTVSTDPWEGLPDDLKVEMMLEMLVDDELPESQRAHLLRSLDAMPERWRDLAVRFLERQTEHASVRQFISSAVADHAPAPANHKFPSQPMHHFRVAAGLIVLAGLTAAVAVAINTSQHPAPQIATVSLPGDVLHSEQNKDVTVNVVPSDNLPSNLMHGDLKNNGSRQIIIVPQGRDKAAIIPVTTEKPQIIY